MRKWRVYKRGGTWVVAPPYSYLYRREFRRFRDALSFAVESAALMEDELPDRFSEGVWP